MIKNQSTDPPKDKQGHINLRRLKFSKNNIKSYTIESSVKLVNTKSIDLLE